MNVDSLREVVVAEMIPKFQISDHFADHQNGIRFDFDLILSPRLVHKADLLFHPKHNFRSKRTLTVSHISPSFTTSLTF